MPLLSPGDPAPDFALPADDGRTVRLSDLRGQTVVLYFYPRDNTPGCTAQACDFRDRAPEFAIHGAVVIGVSPDPVSRHAGFRERYGLPFTLLSDPDHEVATAYGAWGEKSGYGRIYWGIKRSTFVIDPEGRIAHATYGVRAKGEAQRALDRLAAGS